MVNMFYEPIDADSGDKVTANAFSNSWNNLPKGSVYTRDQVVDWFSPLTDKDFYGYKVLELGCGNGSLMTHVVEWSPRYFEGVDLGDSVISAKTNLSGKDNVVITKADITSFRSDGFDLVYCIGVLHHLKNPYLGFNSIIENTKSGGRFHAWVYAKEGNWIVIWFVDPLRKIASKLPWWFTKYLIATPLAVPFYLYAKTIRLMHNFYLFKKLPLYDYSLWISKRNFSFFRHVAFDQLVTPQTRYFSKGEINNLLASDERIDKDSIYLIFRNGNSWKFGGVKK